MTNLGPRIREARQRAGLTLNGLADLLGCRQMTVWRWEHGQRSPTGLYLAAVLRWLGE